MPHPESDRTPMTDEDRNTIQSMLTEAESRIVQAIGTAIHAEITAAEERTNARIEATETGMLTALHGHGTAITARLHKAEYTARDFEVRLEAIEERLLNLETRQHPPQ
jgi:hypothetical protein